ncbi:MAG: ATP-dependent Clp protease ATP-binding subunit [Eubacteriales bacterium]|nr:ATP-dependent Clp protease ATP-binding subunit [Eubacteriales bacterium]
MELQGPFDQDARHVLEVSARHAGLLGKYTVGTEHLLLGLTAKRETTGKILAQAGAGKWRSLYYTAKVAGRGFPRHKPEHISKNLQQVLQKAANSAGKGKAGEGHLLCALVSFRECTARRVLEKMEADIPALERQTGISIAQEPAGWRSMGRLASTTTLDRYTTDLTELARTGMLDPVIGREDELFRLMTILQRRTKNNPVLLGDPGVGKTAVAEALALAIANGDVPEELLGARLVSLDMASLISGTKYRGEFEERLKNIVKELKASKNVIAFIDEVHTLVGAGSAEGAIDASNLLKPALSRGEIRLIGTTTVEEYHKTIEKDAALERRFQRIDVSEPDETAAEEILQGIASRYERHHHVHIHPSALRAAVQISVRISPERHLPDKAIDLLDESCAAVHLEGGSEITEAEIARTAQRFGGFSAAAEGDAARKLLQLEQELCRTVIGQEAAVRAICRAVRRGGAGLRDETRPVAALLLTGSTGVGKTSVCVALAQTLFGKEGLIRIDLSEYQQPQDVSRLIGAPPGYKGYGDGGQLTEKIRRRPRSLVLFDEVEKAHPDVLRLLLRLLEDGRLTDSEGRSADFRHAVVVLTSNLGSGKQGRLVGFSTKENPKQTHAEEEARRVLQPELAARLDDIIVFSALTAADCAAIAAQELARLAKRCLARGTRLVWDTPVEQKLGIVDAKRGARAVRDEVARKVTDPLAGLLLSGRAGQQVEIQAQGDEIKLFASENTAMLSGA